jgi:hypothetical protein
MSDIKHPFSMIGSITLQDKLCLQYTRSLCVSPVVMNKKCCVTPAKLGVNRCPKGRCILKSLTAVTHGGLQNNELGYFYLIQEGVDDGRFTEGDPTR